MYYVLLALFFTDAILCYDCNWKALDDGNSCRDESSLTTDMEKSCNSEKCLITETYVSGESCIIVHLNMIDSSKKKCFFNEKDDTKMVH